jgi:hypothetical protein
MEGFRESGRDMMRAVNEGAGLLEY